MIDWSVIVMPEIFIYIINVIKRRLQMRYIPLFLAVTLFVQDTANYKTGESNQTFLATIGINPSLLNKL